MLDNKEYLGSTFATYMAGLKRGAERMVEMHGHGPLLFILVLLLLLFHQRELINKDPEVIKNSKEYSLVLYIAFNFLMTIMKGSAE